MGQDHPTGIRQLRRTRPLETEEIQGLRVSTLAEMTPIKGWLLATRNALRDYLDAVVPMERLGDAAVVRAFREFDEIYRQPTGASPLAEVVERLARATPKEGDGSDLATFRGLQAPWNSWGHLTARGRHFAQVL